MALIDTLLQPFVDKLKQLLAPFAKLFNFITHFWQSVTSLGGRVQKLIADVLAEVNAWRNFKENISFRTKVINVRSAIEHIQDFWDEIRNAWAAILNLIQELKGKFQTTGDPAQEAQDAVKDIEESGFKEIFSKFPKLLKGLEKVVGFLAIVLDAVESISTAVDDLLTIVAALRDIREAVESGGPLFLKQSNGRRTVRLEDGTTMKIRVGNLHS